MARQRPLHSSEHAYWVSAEQRNPLPILNSRILIRQFKNQPNLKKMSNFFSFQDNLVFFKYYGSIINIISTVAVHGENTEAISVLKDQQRDLSIAVPRLPCERNLRRFYHVGRLIGLWYFKIICVNVGRSGNRYTM